MPEPRLSADELERIRHALRLRRWPDVTTDELARAAGVTRMTLHRRGIGREQVLAGLATVLEDAHRDAVLPALTHAGTGRQRLGLALERLCAVNERYLTLLDALADATDHVFHEAGDGPVLTRGAFTDGLQRILTDGARDGTLRVDDVPATATLLFNAVGWTYRHMRVGHGWPPEQAGPAVVSLLLDGVAGPASGPPSAGT